MKTLVSLFLVFTMLTNPVPVAQDATVGTQSAFAGATQYTSAGASQGASARSAQGTSGAAAQNESGGAAQNASGGAAQNTSGGTASGDTASGGTASGGSDASGAASGTASGTAARAATATKDGYTLVPQKYGISGIDASSQFILSTPQAFSVGELAVMLSIDGEPELGITQGNGNEFVVVPSALLSPNSLYIFRLKRDGEADITWAFQTAKRFQVTSNLPRDAATNVPRRSGIEITFSSEGYTPIDSNFSIEPHVEGRFEYHKNTAVFVPKLLEYKTVYTVTLKAGIKIEGTDEELREDYSFAFETEPEPEYKPKEASEHVSFNTYYAEMPTIEPPSIGFWISYSRLILTPNPKIDVYRFSSVDKAVEAIKTGRGVPRWSRYATAEAIVDTAGMNKVMSFNASGNYNDDYGILTLPDSLPQGFYLLDANLGQSQSQMILQISDLPVQVVADGNKAIVWVNDITTGKASAGAEVHDPKEGKTYKTDENGVAVVERALTANWEEQINVSAANGKACVWFYSPTYSYRYGGDYDYGGYSSNSGQSNEGYWTALQLDRTLFKRNDTVSFFGFVQDRKNAEEIKSVSAVLTLGYRYGYYSYGGGRDILHKQTAAVQNGTYSDEINLPNLDAGSYCLTIYHGDIALGSTYFDVEDFAKPSYKIDAAADKKAVFAGETVTFTASAGFFEGTPVSGLDVSYNIWASGLNTVGLGEAETDIDGNVEVEQRITPRSDTQGETGINFSVEATLPEIGETVKYARARAFINDIDVNAHAKRTNQNAEISVEINTITLDRINNGTAEHYYDYLDKPVAGKPLSVRVFRVYYEKIRQGEYYDYIEKRNIPTYRYDRKEEVIDRFSMATDGNGKAEKAFTVPDRHLESYYATVECVDGNGREISHTVYIGRNYSSYYNNAGSNDYYLDGANDSYSIGEEVSLTLMRGEDPVSRGNCLFVAMQRGIQGWQAGKSMYSDKFAVGYVPNVSVNAYYFDGYNYQSTYRMSVDLRFDYMNNDLMLTASADKDSYKPGDMCTISIKATDKDGNAVRSNVNISLVDEALFELRDYNVDTLVALYRNLGSGLSFASQTHRLYVPSAAARARNEEAMDEFAAADYDVAYAPLPLMDAGGGGAAETYLREEFKDTAFFDTVRTNTLGEAIYTFKLPDNITSWRLTASGISNDLFAGNVVQNILVTNPMFINYSFSNEFLTGDAPVIGVNAYGTSLSGGETVEFEVWDEASPDVKFTASGKPFERINIPLWEMKSEGANALIVKASASNGTSDSIKHQYQVLKTYLEIDESEYYDDVTAGMAFSVGSGGLTRITFTDRGRGAFLWQLLGLRYVYGDRVEKLVARREANRLIAEYFPDLDLYGPNDSFDFSKYQRDDGGVSILPHAGSDLETTVKLMPYIMGDMNSFMAKNYLYDIYEGDSADNKMCALYGLALLREPVLLDLDNYALLDELSVKDLVYIALGYCALGEVGIAAELYNSRIAPKLEKVEPYFRVNTGIDNDDILEATSAACLLATQLGKAEKEGLYQYCIRNYTTDILINLEKLSYIKHEIAKKNESNGEITYTLFGEEFTRELKNGGSYTLRIPAQSINEFKLLKVSGDVGAVSTFKKPMTELGEIDAEIKVFRQFYKANEWDIIGESGYGNSGNGDDRYDYDGYDYDSYGGGRSGNNSGSGGGSGGSNGGGNGGSGSGGSGSSSSVATREFEQGDLVRVQLWIDYSAKAIDGSYSVTDYLPSGLAYVGNSAKIEGSQSFGYGYYRYCAVEGQKVTFYDYNGRFNKGYLYYYYARVVNPGVFKAEGTLVQNLAAPDYFTVGEDSIITIK